MIISLLVARDKLGGIGKDNRLPWHLSTDLRRFKRLTMGHHLIMGRKTYESIGRVLPGRTMIVVTHQRNYQAEGCLVVHSLDDAFRIAKERGEGEVFVIGGGQIFTQALARADRIYLTEVHAIVQADTYFPPLEERGWEEVERVAFPAGKGDAYPTTFRVLKRKPMKIY